MRILAIRGENLASLPKVEVRFDTGPLAETRLFAITGPTGAGKSTLLDALCLALYDRVPRLLHAREAATEELEVPASDPRAIVRRGAAEARAEVEFVAQDGLRHRAVWEVWRARKRADGRIQNQRVRLFAGPDGDEREITGNGKIETLELIRSRVGLSFDEFRRAVLLAQGDFAAFLAAKADERAALLERMTGTQLYAALSARAYERAKEEDEALRRLEDEAANQAPLADAARAELEARLEVGGQRRAALEARRATLEAEARWYATERSLAQEAARAEAERAAAEAAWAQAEPRRKDLALAREAELLRPAHQALLAAEEACRRTAQREKEAASAQAGAEARVKEAQEAAKEAAGAKAKQADLQAARAPEVAEARRLDGALSAQAVTVGEAQAAAQRWGQAAGEAARARAAAHMLVERLEEKKANLQAWLDAQESTRVLAAQWPRWSAELGVLAKAHTEAKNAEDAAKDCEGVVRHASRKEHEARERLEAVTRELTAAAEARRALAEAMTEVGKPSFAAQLSQALGLVVEHRSRLEVLKTVAKEIRSLHREKQGLERVVEEQEALHQAAQAEVSDLYAKVEAAQEAFAQARRAAAQANLQREMARRRHELLHAGEACPLCGSEHHPILERPEETPPELDDQTEALEAERDWAEAALQGARAKSADAARARDAAQADAARLAPTLAVHTQTWADTRERLAQAWVESPLLAQHGIQKVALLVPEAPKLTGSTTELTAAVERLDELREHLLGLTTRQEGLQAELDAAMRREEALQGRRGATQAEVDAVVGARTKAEQDLAAAQARGDAARARRDEALATLEAPLARLPDWRARALRNPAAFEKDLSIQVETYEERQRGLADLEPQRQEAQANLQATTEKDLATGQAWEEAKATLDERHRAQAALHNQRKELLDGRAVEDFERRLKDAMTAAERRAELAAAAGQRAQEEASVARTRCEAARQAREEAEAALAADRAAFTAALERSRIPSRDALERMLGRGPEWLESLAEALAALDERRAKAQATHEDRAQRLAAHQATDAPSRAEAEVQEDLRGTHADLAPLVDELADLRGRLTRDDRARAALAALLPRIEAQRASLELWAELNQLIGSADGKKLRTFAQGLTLDVLVEQANLHLQELRPRYNLRRVAGQAMELAVVDHDLGDEVRFIATLSGGERFLVSLALALGLSTLSSKSVRIESLFIDEGFGSLDRGTLEVALATLDQLQAEGRTVGIISHIAELSERIGYRVEVRPTGPGTSEVRVKGV
ncbi:MAG: AAA family ATPase [Deltaproteobacteria bacterium]|nr:AAA family ATPase [Deltaproteobacteria bacterium]